MYHGSAMPPPAQRRHEALDPRVVLEGPDPIDALIVPLVNALTAFGVATFASCQGGHRNQPYPWVSFRLRASDVPRLTALLPQIEGWELAFTWLEDFGGLVGTLQTVANGAGGTADLREAQSRIPAVASVFREAASGHPAGSLVER